MAPDARLAKLLNHIAACHSADLPGHRLPLYASADRIGYLEPELAERLAALGAIALGGRRAALQPGYLQRLTELAQAAGIRLRGELFDVRATVEGPVLATLDRGALPAFGVIGVGVHLNGLVQRPDGLHLWVGKRAADKKLDPGKLDHLVAGGVPAGYGVFETLLKEGEEEASLPPELARQAVAVARFDYNMARAEGLRRDVVFAYDLILPENFQPAPADGEVEHFELWPLARALEVMSTTDDFKFNVNLVLIDCCIRHGLITGERAAALRAALNAKQAEPAPL